MASAVVLCLSETKSQHNAHPAQHVDHSGPVRASDDNLVSRHGLAVQKNNRRMPSGASGRQGKIVSNKSPVRPERWLARGSEELPRVHTYAHERRRSTYYIRGCFVLHQLTPDTLVLFLAQWWPTSFSTRGEAADVAGKHQSTEKQTGEREHVVWIGQLYPRQNRGIVIIFSPFPVG